MTAYKCESPITVLKIVCTLAGCFEAPGFSLSSLSVIPARGTLNIEILESQIILKSSGAINPKGLNRLTKFGLDIWFYLTLYTFSFAINESRLSDTRCLIQYVV